MGQQLGHQQHLVERIRRLGQLTRPVVAQIQLVIAELPMLVLGQIQCRLVGQIHSLLGNHIHPF